MNELPPPLPDQQQKTDAEHMRLLAIFHYVFAGFAALGVAFLAMNLVLMSSVLAHPEMWKQQAGSQPPPAEIFVWMKWVLGILALLAAAMGLGNFLSGLYMTARRHRVFSMVVAAINCLQMPFGTILGVFTILVLNRDSVKRSYDSPQADAPHPFS